MTPIVDGDRRIYQNRNRRWLIATSLVVLFFAGSSLIFEKDPDTGLRPVPSDYLWVVLPAALLIAVLAWRAFKVKVITDRRGVEIVRVVGRERIPWSRLRRFEVHPTPGKQGTAVVARTADELLITVSTSIMVRPVRDRDEARRLARIRSDELATALEQDRVARQMARSGATPPEAPSPASSESAAPTGPGG